MEELKRLGLTGYEIKLYTTLLKYGTLGGAALSELSKVPKTAVYPHVKSLVQKGLVQELRGDQKLFDATSPDVALKSFVSQQKEEIDALTQTLLPELRALRSEKTPDKICEPVRLSKGNAASREITLKYFTCAKKFIHILGWRYMFHDKDRTHIHPKLLELAKHVKIRLIITEEHPNLVEYIRALQDKGVQVRQFHIKNFSLVIRDGEACKITLRPIGKEHQKTNIRITDADLASFMNDYFMTIWKKAKKVSV